MAVADGHGEEGFTNFNGGPAEARGKRGTPLSVGCLPCRKGHSERAEGGGTDEHDGRGE